MLHHVLAGLFLVSELSLVAGMLNLQFWYLARESVRSSLGELKGPAWPLPGKTKLTET